MSFDIHFDNTYSQLPEDFYEKRNPKKVSNPKLIQYNEELGKNLGIDIDGISNDELVEVFSGNKILEDSTPIAQVYAGHQFGYFSERLGDGRAILLGEIIDTEGNRKDIQLKGAGRTLYSRSGDGRAPLASVIREYIVSEAMYTLGVSTTRSLAIVTTGDEIYRDTIVPSAILTRIASSHIRIGTFEYFSRAGKRESLKKLLDYTIERHYKKVQNNQNPYLSFFEEVGERQAKLVAQWMNLGFIHGVMNTDNISISGETIDYGPCAFMDNFNQNKVFSSIDQEGRYAYGNQKNIITWNLAKLAECIVPFIDTDIQESIQLLEKGLENFQRKIDIYYIEGLCKKIGIFSERKEEDISLIIELLGIMEKQEVDFTLCFRYLSEYVENEEDTEFYALFSDREKISQWINNWKKRIYSQKLSKIEISEAMKKINPVFIPRNHRIEEAIIDAVENNSYVKMNKLIEVLKNPYIYQEKYKEYIQAPKEKERVEQTFCGT